MPDAPSSPDSAAAEKIPLVAVPAISLDKIDSARPNEPHSLGPRRRAEVTIHDVRHAIERYLKGKRIEEATSAKLVETYTAALVTTAMICEQGGFSDLTIRLPIAAGKVVRTKIADERSL